MASHHYNQDQGSASIWPSVLLCFVLVGAMAGVGWWIQTRSAAEDPSNAVMVTFPDTKDAVEGAELRFVPGSTSKVKHRILDGIHCRAMSDHEWLCDEKWDGR